MASNDTNYPARPQPARSYTPMQAASSASTWYLVVGAAILLMVLYLLTTGMMRPTPDPVLMPQGADGITVPATQP